MLVVLSPSKAMDFAPAQIELTSSPRLLDRAQGLVDVLQTKSADDIGALMKLSDKLSQLNFDRYQEWSEPSTPQKQALFAFTGDTYKDIPLAEYTEEDLDIAQASVRILSGLYGVLRPLDLIQPYRLEMGTRLKTEVGKNLYEYWGDEIAQQLTSDLDGHTERVLVNCASNEYFKSVARGALDARIIEPVFKQEKNGEYKVISFFAKRARGMMADFIVRERITEPADLTGFSLGGYYYDEDESTPDRPVFKRDAV